MTLISGCVSVSATGLARDFGTDIQNLAITPAGPMANFLAMGCPFLVPFLGGFAIWFTMMNLAGAAFNLLPIANSDGARALALVGLRHRSCAQ
jgi:Zn-dependent protease